MAEEGKIFAGTLIYLSVDKDLIHHIPVNGPLVFPGLGRRRGGTDTLPNVACSHQAAHKGLDLMQSKRVLPAIPKQDPINPLYNYKNYL